MKRITVAEFRAMRDSGKPDKAPSRKRRNAGGETALVKAVLAYLKLRGAFAWRTNNIPAFDPVKKIYRTFHGVLGVSDVLCLLDGKFMALECKTATGKLSEHQRLFLDNVNRNGGVGAVIRSIDDVSLVIAKEMA